jgi:hypothetical protein
VAHGQGREELVQGQVPGLRGNEDAAAVALLAVPADQLFQAVLEASRGRVAAAERRHLAVVGVILDREHLGLRQQFGQARFQGDETFLGDRQGSNLRVVNGCCHDDRGSEIFKVEVKPGAPLREESAPGLVGGQRPTPEW